MVRLDVAPIRRPDPSPKRRGRGLAVGNDPAYTSWLRGTAVLIRAHWWPRHRLDGAVSLLATFVIDVPKKQAARLYGLPVAVRPDIDRYAHALMDAVSLAANVWGTDDGCVAHVDASKWYRDENDRPHIIFDVRPAPRAA